MCDEEPGNTLEVVSPGSEGLCKDRRRVLGNKNAASEVHALFSAGFRPVQCNCIMWRAPQFDLDLAVRHPPIYCSLVGRLVSPPSLGRGIHQLHPHLKLGNTLLKFATARLVVTQVRIVTAEFPNWPSLEGLRLVWDRS